jgi:uncharacterized protein (TIGR02246 family)
MYKLLSAALVLSASLLVTSPTTGVLAEQAREHEVIAVERAALDRWAKGDPEGFLTTYADEVTYFDPFQERRVDGRSALRALYAPLAGKFSIDRYEIMNPKVEQSGDIAVLSYNLQNFAKQPDGSEKVMNRWNSTAVFRRVGGKWRTIHSHWSFTKPDLRMPSNP